MKRATIFASCLALLALFPPAVRAAGKRPMTVEDLFRFQRLSDPQISPDGQRVAYVVAKVDLPGNKITSSIWLAPTGKGGPRQLTNTTKKDSHPRWSPDGKHLLFVSNRGGDSQFWVIDVAGGEARQLTAISSEASDAIWSRDGKQIAFVSAVYPEFSEKPFKESDEQNKKKKEEIEKSPVKAKVFKRLFYRHWAEYVEDKRQHLFVMPFNDGKGGEPKDVTPGDRDAFPTSDTFATGDNFTFSPDGTHLVFTAVPEKDEAWSTNYDLCRVPVTGGSVKWECLTKDNPAADSGPVFSPDGKMLAYRAQKKAGFEADRWQLMVVHVDAGGAFEESPQSVTADFDRWADAPVWLPDNKTIYFTAEDKAAMPLFQVALDDRTVSPAPFLGNRPTTAEGTHGSLTRSADGKTWSFTLARLNHPPIVVVHQSLPDGRPEERMVSPENLSLTVNLELPRPESVQVKVEGAEMQMWILKPPDFDPNKNRPLVYLVHGGPQGAWEDGWSYRWNPELWAAQGYVVALPNPRGSTGFGQKYINAISGDWGGKCYDDLMAGLAYLEKQPYIDPERMASAGASFGGYMMKSFQGHTTKFKTLITHCGVYNFDSMYALTDELWFDEWEHGGPPWVHRESYEKYSPHKFAKDFKTPMLIIHNDLDFRVPVAEGHQLFTTLQRLHVPSKSINFPDEGHWVLKPANSAYWHREVFAWLKKYTPPGGR